MSALRRRYCRVKAAGATADNDDSARRFRFLHAGKHKISSDLGVCSAAELHILPPGRRIEGKAGDAVVAAHTVDDILGMTVTCLVRKLGVRDKRAPHRNDIDLSSASIFSANPGC